MAKTLYPLPAVVNPPETVCVEIKVPNEPSHRQAFIGAVFNLTRWYSWQRDDNQTGKAVADVWMGVFMQMMTTFYDDCGCGIPDGGECNTLAMSHPSLSYSPNDPFQSPDYAPPGYVVPPWYNNAAIPLPGVQPGDAMVNAASIVAPLPLPGDFPRLRIPVSGTGEVEIEFVKIPLGGIAVIVVDDNILSSTIVDLSVRLDNEIQTIISTILSVFGVTIQGAAANTEVQEIVFTTPGDHHIDITFYPVLELDLSFVGYGGGIRRVTLCTDAEVGETPVPEIQIVNDCDLQWRPNSEADWITVGNVCGSDGADGADGAPGADGADGADGAPGADGQDGEDCDCDPEEIFEDPPPDGYPPEVPQKDARACPIAWGIQQRVVDNWAFNLERVLFAPIVITSGLAVETVVQDRAFNFSQLVQLEVWYSNYALLPGTQHQTKAQAHLDRMFGGGVVELIRNMIYCGVLTAGGRMTDTVRDNLSAQFKALEDGDDFWNSVGDHFIAVPDWMYDEWEIRGAYEYADATTYPCDDLTCSGVPCDCGGQTIITEDPIAVLSNVVTVGDRTTYMSNDAFRFDSDGILEFILPAEVCLFDLNFNNPDGGQLGSRLCQLFVNGENLGYAPPPTTSSQSWGSVLLGAERKCTTIRLECDTGLHFIDFMRIDYCFE